MTFEIDLNFKRGDTGLYAMRNCEKCINYGERKSESCVFKQGINKIKEAYFKIFTVHH